MELACIAQASPEQKTYEKKKGFNRANSYEIHIKLCVYLPCLNEFHRWYPIEQIFSDIKAIFQY